MFRSDFSKKIFKGSPSVVITHKRKKSYEYKIREGRGRGFEQEYSTVTTHGWEIVKEMRVAPSEVDAVKAIYGDGIFVDESPATSA